MPSTVDLRELAIDRVGGPAAVRNRRPLLTRYVLPLMLILGFLSLVAWASRDIVFPPKAVTVMPVYSTTAEIRREGTPLFKAAGWVEPRPTPVRIPALASGVVEELLVVEDQPVDAGEPIAILVEDDAKLNHERTLADLRLREAELEQARSALTAAETRLKHPVHRHAVLGEAQASLARIETELKNLPFEIRRAEAEYASARKSHEGKLAASGVVAGIEIDIAQSKKDAALALVEELRERSESLKQERTALIQRRNALQTQLELLADEIQAKETAFAQVKGASARVEQARIAVAEAKLQWDRMTVRAPIAGRIYRLIAPPGTRVGIGPGHRVDHDGSTIATMYRPDRLQIRVDVRFEHVPQVGLGQPVEINNPVVSSPLAGTVLFVSSEADIQKNTLQVKVEISDPPPTFKPEMLVDVTFLAPPQPERETNPSEELKLFVPQQLVRQGEGGAFVWVADQSQQIARQARVETGTVGSNGLVEITSGLTIANRLIVGGVEGLREGDRIVIRGEDSTFGIGNTIR